jgi:hypothetical protein
MVTPAALPIYPASSGYLPPMKWGEVLVKDSQFSYAVCFALTKVLKVCFYV